MDFSSLVKAVQDFWNFVWPPVVCLVILLGTIYAVAPSAASRVGKLLTRLRPSPSSQLSAAKNLKRFGLDKLLPILAAFCVLFLMDVARTMVVLVGDALPPSISYRYDLWFLQHASDERIPCLWAHFDDAPRLNELQNDIERTLSESEATSKNSHVFENIRNWNEQSGKAHTAFSACKFFIAWALFWTLVEIALAKRLLRALFFVVCLAIFSLAGTFYFFRHIWAIEQEQYARVEAVQVFLFQKPPQCRSISATQQNAYNEIVTDAQRSADQGKEHQWWTIRMFDAYYLRWIWKQINATSGDRDRPAGYSPQMVREENGAELTLEKERTSIVAGLSAATVHRLSTTENATQHEQGSEGPPPLNVAQIADTVRSTVTLASLPQYARKRILWVDDHPEHNIYEAQLFKSLGMVVETVLSTRGALERLSEGKYDVVISNMLRGTETTAGYKLLKSMQARKIETPLIIYSASANPTFRAEAIEMGAKGETNDPTDLLKLVTAAVSNPNSLMGDIRSPVDFRTARTER
jgi:CheY-like chemotaxis protein